MHHPRRVWFAWMSSWCQDYAFTDWQFDWLAQEVSYDQHVNIIACHRLTKHCLPDSVSCLLETDTLQVLAQVRICVWIAVSQVNSVFVICKLKVKTQGIVVLLFCFLLLGLNWLAKSDIPIFALCLVVLNISTVTVPTNPFLFGLLHAIDQRFHALIVIAFIFHEIHYVELVILVLFCIFDLEKVPLRKACCIVIIFQMQVVLQVRLLISFVQIARFESAFEN